MKKEKVEDVKATFSEFAGPHRELVEVMVTHLQKIDKSSPMEIAKAISVLIAASAGSLVDMLNILASIEGGRDKKSFKKRVREGWLSFFDSYKGFPLLQELVDEAKVDLEKAREKKGARLTLKEIEGVSNKVMKKVLDKKGKKK